MGGEKRWMMWVEVGGGNKVKERERRSIIYSILFNIILDNCYLFFFKFILSLSVVL